MCLLHVHHVFVTCIFTYYSIMSTMCTCTYQPVQFVLHFCSADIPVFPTVTAVITLEKYDEKKTPPHIFMVPRDYRKVSNDHDAVIHVHVHVGKSNACHSIMSLVIVFYTCMCIALPCIRLSLRKKSKRNVQ